MFNQDQLNPELIPGANIHPPPTPEQTCPPVRSSLDHVLGADPASLG